MAIFQTSASSSVRLRRDRVDSARRGTRHAGRTIIGDDVWIVARAIGLKGVIVGAGAVIGAGAAAMKDVSPHAIVAGVLAHIVRFRFSPEMIARLRASRWRTRDLSALPHRDYSQPAEMLDQIERAALAPLQPQTLTWPPHD